MVGVTFHDPDTVEQIMRHLYDRDSWSLCPGIKAGRSQLGLDFFDIDLFLVNSECKKKLVSDETDRFKG